MFVALLAFTYRTISTQEESLIQERIKAALKDSEVIKAAIWNGMMTKDREVIRQIVEAIGSHEGFKELNIYDQKGILHYTSNTDNKSGIGSASPSQSDSLLKDISKNLDMRYRFSDDGSCLNVVNPLKNTQGCSTIACHGSADNTPVLGALQLKLPLEKFRARIDKQAQETLLFAAGLFLLVSTSLGLVIIFRVIPAIRKLQANARNLASGNYNPQSQDYGSDEIADLARSFDEMSQQITQSQTKLEESRRLYRELFQKVPCYLTVVDKNYRISRSNEAFKNEFGDQSGNRCFRAFKGRDSKCENCLVDRTFSDKLPHRSEEIWLTGDHGEQTFVILNTSPIYNESGGVSEVLEMAVDVTRVEKLQKQLKKKEQQFQTLFENVPCYLTVVDRSFRIAFANKIFMEDFGEAIGKNCYLVYKGRNEKCEDCPVEKTFIDGTIHSSEEVWHRNGETKHIVVRTAPIEDDQGNIVEVMEMSTDITEIKTLQNELAILGETVAGMSHDVKNILSGLEGGVYIVDSGLRSGKEDRTRTGWNMVKKNVEKVSGLVKDILYASKERTPEYEECGIADILKEISDLYGKKAKESNVDLVQEFDDNLGTWYLDPKGIHSAISNLVSNAIQACHSTRAKSSFYVRIGARVENSVLSLWVADNGSGMPEEVRQKLFTKFYSTKGSKGTGLGLVVTRKIIEEHGGTIAVESATDVGTTFHIEIPLSRPKQVQASRSM
ncbi:MAG TPA: ATP-binding protein [Desulfomonilaceae bacterium]|nr:ATP-binding protein [Desulfomonilaceae bacterium]